LTPGSATCARSTNPRPDGRPRRRRSPGALSCLSKFYDYGIREAEVVEHSPVANVRRPKVSDDSSTIGLTADKLDKPFPPPRPCPRATVSSAYAHVIDVDRHQLGQPPSGVQQHNHDRPVAQYGRLGGPQQRALLVLIQRPRRGLRDLLARDDRRAEPEERLK
jgi:hypothetical protein